MRTEQPKYCCNKLTDLHGDEIEFQMQDACMYMSYNNKSIRCTCTPTSCAVNRVSLQHWQQNREHLLFC